MKSLNEITTTANIATAVVPLGMTRKTFLSTQDFKNKDDEDEKEDKDKNNSFIKIKDILKNTNIDS